MKTIAMLFLTGCYFHAVPVETTSTRYVEGTIGGEERVALTITSTGEEVRVAARQAKACRRVAIRRTTRVKHARFENGFDVWSGGVGVGAIIVVPAAAVATVIGIVSGVATVVEVGVDRARSWDTEMTSEAIACGDPVGGIGVEIELPSGMTMISTSAADGIARFGVRGEETGWVTARADGTEARAMYYADRKACLADRGARFEQGVALPSCEASNDGERAIEEVWALVGIATGTDCAAAIDAGEMLARRAPTLFARVEAARGYRRCVRRR